MTRRLCCVGDQVLDPGWTMCGKWVFYSTYDVTSQVRQGGNCVDAVGTLGAEREHVLAQPSEAEGVRDARMAGNTAAFTVGSGAYRFVRRARAK